MKRRTAQTSVARIWRGPGGYYYCDNAGPIGIKDIGQKTKAAAMQQACHVGYRYATGEGTYWGDEIRAIPEFIRARAR